MLHACSQSLPASGENDRPASIGDVSSHSTHMLLAVAADWPRASLAPRCDPGRDWVPADNYCWPDTVIRVTAFVNLRVKLGAEGDSRNAAAPPAMTRSSDLGSTR